MTSNDAVFPLQSSLSFRAPRLDFSVDFLFLRRDTKPQRHRVMFCEECPVVTRMMSPFTHQPNTAPVLSAQLRSSVMARADGKCDNKMIHRSQWTLLLHFCNKCLFGGTFIKTLIVKFKKKHHLLWLCDGGEAGARVVLQFHHQQSGSKSLTQI